VKIKRESKGGESLNKGLIAIIIIVIVVLVAVGAWFFMKPAPSVNITTTNNTSSSVNTANQYKNQTNNTTTTNITAAKAKELAGKYVGTGVTLETATLTTYKNIQVWKVPVVTYSPDKVYLDPIYINAKTGARVT
jgi:cytoskeletal protein RodZ